MIEVRNLVKDYGDHHAVKNISFTVPDGQVVGLLGPNGAGKSTTMNIMTGYISATSGEVKIGGYDILENPIEAKKKMGYLPEIPPLYNDMTVDEYLNFVCDLKGIRGKKAKADSITEVTEAVRITDMRKRLIKNLSKGYRQRVGLAEALIGNPPLLILDEPTVGLDPNQIIEIRSLIKSLSKNHTIILSSHILSEVSAVCDYVLIIDKGELVAEDKPENLSSHFSNQNHIYLVIKGEQDAIERALSENESIQTYDIKEESQDLWSVTAACHTKEDIRDELFYYFADRRLPVYKMEREMLSLEDVFLKLTGQDAETMEREADLASEKIESQGQAVSISEKAENGEDIMGGDQ